MPPLLLATLAAVFLSVALVTGSVTWIVLTRAAPGRRRLETLTQPRVSSLLVLDAGQLTAAPDPLWDKVAAMLPTSRGTVKRLRRELSLAGYDSAKAAGLFSLAELTLPLVLGSIPLLALGDSRRWMAAALGAIAGYMLPGVVLRRRLRQRQKEIQNGLADALDLLVLCLEAGSGLDQAIVKASDELSVAYPALGDQLRLVVSETRAGKSRLDAFRALATRTQVDEVRALVTMLVQTDRFGTSVAQALRTHADVCRTKRRQRAEEKAEKVAVKLVFPLVFCLFPALYVVMLGPAFLQFMRTFGSN
ncbi:MAG: type II secretion system F family protein [Acidobacteria bacterium]|nr:type II secretion system F family protein [Acidobacteriota bacterium]